MREESPKPELRSEAFSELRKQSHAQIERETAERVKVNPKPSEAEINAGAFPEMLEPQVRDAIFQMRKKGYATESSGFGGKTGDVQSMDGYFEIDAKTEQALRDVGVEVLRDQGFGPSYSFIRFSPDEPSLEKMKAKWDAVAQMLPDRGHQAEPSISGHAEEFLTKYAPDRTDVLQRITELRAQHDKEQEVAMVKKAEDTEAANASRFAREQEMKAADQAEIDALRESVGLKLKE